MSLNRILSTVVFLSVLSLSGCDTDTVDQTDHYKGQSVTKLYSDATTAMKDNNHEEALKIYSALASHYPDSKYAKQAMINTIKINYEEGEVDATMAAADEYLRFYPFGESAAYASYMKGYVLLKEHGSWLQRKFKTPPSNYDIESLNKAFFIFRHLVTTYPKTKYASNAAHLMSKIKVTLSQHELKTAKFYLKQGSYLAAVNRARQAISFNNDKSLQLKAYKVMSSAYKLIGDKKAMAEVRLARKKLMRR